MHAILSAPAVPIGRIKSFGPMGEQYEVVRPLRALSDGDWWIEIQLVKTGEKAEYPLSHIYSDPDGL
jgi:hypothetical protein